MILAYQLKDTLRKTREALGGNFDRKDPEFVSLYEELKRLFGKKNLDEISQDEMKQNIGSLQQIFDKVVGIPCFMPANMKSNRVDLSGIEFIAEKDAKRLSKHFVEAGDIFL